ncbi:MAG: tellurite resistance/C4-dicarboxylate transporter family protein, partial [Nocardioidaceae bacterium]
MRSSHFLVTADARLRGLSPSYFALVMATGIVSIAADQIGVAVVEVGLFALNVAAYLALWLLTALRLARHRSDFVADLTDHRRSHGFLTIVAGTCVLGVQMILIGDGYAIATGLLIVAAVLWVLLIYTIFTALTIKPEKPSLAEGISGSWLLAVVATQSIAVLIALLSAHWDQPLRLHANFVALSMWLWGGMLYIWIISLIFYRYTFFRFSPADLAPPYWINVGAMAISALAGSLLIDDAPAAPFLDSLRPFLEGFTVFYWATGTWWIPMIA